MLPHELLKVIFGALSRADLESLMLVNSAWRTIVVRDFNREPLRRIEQLSVYEDRYCEFIFNRIHEHTGAREYTYCYDIEEFGRRMQFARVGELKLLPSVLHEGFFDILLPHRDAWRNGCVKTPRKFATLSLLESAFSELLFCKSMTVRTKFYPIQWPFLSLPAVRECSELNIERAPRQPTVVEVIEWLSAGSLSPEPKRLRIDSNTCDFDVTELLHQLKADFAESKKAAPYRIDYILGIDSYSGDPAERILKASTSERLEIDFLPQDTIRGIRVERKLIETER